MLAACGQSAPNKAQATQALRNAYIVASNNRINAMMRVMGGMATNRAEAEAMEGGTPEEIAAKIVIHDLNCQPDGDSDFQCDTKFTNEKGEDNEETFDFTKVNGTWQAPYDVY
jgi:hypothetical protein